MSCPCHPPPAIPGITTSIKPAQTDNERIKDITVLPPPEHLIRFFPSGAQPVEKLISKPASHPQGHRAARMTACWSSSGPCSVHDPAAALEYAPRLQAVRDQSPTRWKS